MVGVKLVILLILFQINIFAHDIVNYGLRGKNHPVTNVPYNRLGFPVFESSFNCKLPFHLINVTDTKQFRYCSNKLREYIKLNPKYSKHFTKEQLKDINAKKPVIDKLTWHHHQAKSQRLLQLVNREIHNKTAHSGGRAIYGGGALGRLGKVESLSQSSIILKNDKINSMKDYNSIAKSINKKAIAVPAILTKDNKIIMSIKNGAYSGLSVLAIDSLISSYDYLKGNIYSSEFERQIVNNTIKASSVSAIECLVMFIIPTPHGLIILGAGVGTYILVDTALEKYKHYKEKHFLNADDLAVYGIKLDSILDINDENTPLNVDKWQ